MTPQNQPAAPLSRVPGPGIVRYFPAAVIIAAVFAAYANAFSVPFLFDDQINITHNPYIRMTEFSASQIKRAMVQDSFQLRPLSNITFALDFYLHGLNRAAMHAENVALHAAAALALYALILALIPAGRPGRPGRRAAAVAGSLAWALHPAHTQAVTYLVQRQTVLAGLGSLLAVLFYLTARRGSGRKRPRLFALAAAAAALAAGSKETGMLVPAYWLILELTVLRSDAEQHKSRAPWVVAALLAAAAVPGALIVARTGLLPRYLADYQVIGYGPGGRVLTEARVVVSYLITMIFPHPARLALDRQVLASSSLVHPLTTLPAALIMLAAGAAGLGLVRRQPLAAFLILSFGLALLPESTVIPIDLTGDHRIYLYSLFILPPLVAAAVLVRPGKPTLALLTAALILAGVLTHQRNRTWRSARAVWRDSAGKSPGLARPWSNYCSALIEDREFRYALSACGRALALDPSLDVPAVSKAVALAALGRTEEAAELFRRTAESHPESALAQFNYGRLLEARGDAAGAEKSYLRALHADAFHFEARLRRALLMIKSHGGREAREEAVMLTRLFPDRPEGWILTAEIMARGGEAGAETMLGRAEGLALTPDQREWIARVRRTIAGPRPSGP